MQGKRGDEDLSDVTLRQLLALQATAGPDQSLYGWQWHRHQSQ